MPDRPPSHLFREEKLLMTAHLEKQRSLHTGQSSPDNHDPRRIGRRCQVEADSLYRRGQRCMNARKNVSNYCNIDIEIVSSFPWKVCSVSRDRPRRGRPNATKSAWLLPTVFSANSGLIFPATITGIFTPLPYLFSYRNYHTFRCKVRRSH